MTTISPDNKCVDVLGVVPVKSIQYRTLNHHSITASSFLPELQTALEDVSLTDKQMFCYFTVILEHWHAEFNAG